MRRMILAGLALQLCAAPVFAQSSPTTTPATPQVTTPPPPSEHPPTGGPNTLPTGEPANVIDRSDHSSTGVSPGANSFTETQARNRLRQRGFSEVSALTKDHDGIWRGSAVRDGAQVHVSVDYKGTISSK
jgi:periplasmic protein CpxP/Spy